MIINDGGLAPISVPVYTRHDHFKKCIQALKEDLLADQSILYIFSDGANPEHEEQVQRLREYASSIDGFKEVRLFFREVNGYVENTKAALTIPVSKFGKCIYLEDDIVVAPGFLTFMNQALDYYQGDNRVISISGYTPPIKIQNRYKKNFLALPRATAWGIGVFPRTIDILNETRGPAERARIMDDAMHNPRLTIGGPDMPKRVRNMLRRPYLAGDILLSYHQSITGAVSIYPRKSLVRNIGHDGSGVHCGETSAFDIPALWDKTGPFHFDSDLAVNQMILKANYVFRRDINRPNWRARARMLLTSSSLHIINAIAFRNVKKVVVASAGRSGSTMLTTAIADALIRKYCVWFPLRVQKALRTRSVEFVARLDRLSLSSAQVVKTHDLYKPEFLEGCKALFVFGDPLESALSAAEKGKSKGSSWIEQNWIEQHVYHLCGDGLSSDLFHQDVLNFRAQISSWVNQNNVLAIHYDDLWDRVDEISAFVGFSVKLPDRKKRVKKRPPKDVNNAMFDELADLAEELRNSSI